jgi:hypothetical protein
VKFIKKKREASIKNDKFSDKTGILFCSKGEEHTKIGIEHLRNNKELYFSVGYPIKEIKFSYPLIGLIHVSGVKTKEVKYRCRIIGIKKYHFSDHKDILKKPKVWMIQQRDNLKNNYKTTIIIDLIKPYIYETKKLKDLCGNNVKQGPRGYQSIILPFENGCSI